MFITNLTRNSLFINRRCAVVGQLSKSSSFKNHDCTTLSTQTIQRRFEREALLHAVNMKIT